MNDPRLNPAQFRPMLPPVAVNPATGFGDPDSYGATAPTLQQALFLCLLSMCAPVPRCLSMADRVGRPSGLPGSVAPVRQPCAVCHPIPFGDGGWQLLSQLWSSVMSHSAQNPSATLPAVLTFEGAELKIIDRDGLPWITSGDLGRALGYKRGGDQVASIYRQHSHEFCEAMTATISLRDVASDFNADSPGRGNPNVPVRIFSPRGAHLIGMFSRTAKAAAFRRWVLDVLDGYTCPPVPTGAVEGPLDTLRCRRILFMLDGYGRPTASAVPDDAAVMRPADLPDWIADPVGFTHEELHGIAVAALRRLNGGGGAGAVRGALVEVDQNWLMVDEIQFRHLHNELSFMLMQQVAPPREGRR